MEQGSRKRKKMSRKRRQQIIRRRRIAAAVILSLLIVIVVVLICSLRSCVTKKTAVDNENEGFDKTQPSKIQQLQTEAQTEVPTEKATLDFQVTVPDNAESTFTTSKGYQGYVVDGVTYIAGFLIANKTYALPKSFIPQNPEVPVTSGHSTVSLDKTLMENFRKMQNDAKAQGLNIYIASGYRSYNTQVTVYNGYVATDGKELADTYSSRPGHSEHQTGLCFDLNSIEDSFQYTKEGIWVNDNAYKYGFAIRFPKGQEEKTGYQYESWHLRYVGTELATKLYNNGNWISMEEYFGIDSKYTEN